MPTSNTSKTETGAPRIGKKYKKITIKIIMTLLNSYSLKPKLDVLDFISQLESSNITLAEIISAVQTAKNTSDLINSFFKVSAASYNEKIAEFEYYKQVFLILVIIIIIVLFLTVIATIILYVKLFRKK